MIKNLQLKKIFFLTIFICINIYSYSQERIDTIYYDKNWKGVSNKTFADFYRIAVYPNNSNYKKLFRDYYITGELQCSGAFISVNQFDDSQSVFDGECSYFYKNGKVSSKITFSNGKKNGEFCEYSEDGLVKRKGIFLNDKLSGLYTEFLDDGGYIQAEYINGEPKYNYYVRSNKNGQIAKIKYSDNKPLWETPSVSERKTEYKDGTPWQYYIKNGLIVAQTNTTTRDYGKWHRVDIVIANNSMVPIDFNPEEDITAYSINKKDIKRT